MENKKENRREFLVKSAKAAGFCACASSLASALASCERHWEEPAGDTGKDVEIKIDDEPYLQLVGYGVYKSFEGCNYGIPLIVARLSEDEFACFSSLCTHDSCFGYEMSLPLGDYPEFRDIVCNCHGSRFDPWQNGKPVKGPAEKPLRRYRTSFDKEKNIVIIHF